MATTRDSVNYAAIWTNKYLADARLRGGRVVPLPFEATILSVAATGDIYRLTVIPANARVVGLECTSNGFSASAGVGLTVIIGDSGDTDRYMASTDMDVVNQQGVLAAAGAGYTPTSDTIVYCTISGTPIVAKVLVGCLYIIPGV